MMDNLVAIATTEKTVCSFSQANSRGRRWRRRSLLHQPRHPVTRSADAPLAQEPLREPEIPDRVVGPTLDESDLTAMHAVRSCDVEPFRERRVQAVDADHGREH